MLEFSRSLYLCNHLSESIHSWIKGTLPNPTLPTPSHPSPTLPYPTLPHPALPHPTPTPPTLPYPTLPLLTHTPPTGLPYPTPHHPNPPQPCPTPTPPYPTLPLPYPDPTHTLLPSPTLPYLTLLYPTLPYPTPTLLPYPHPTHRTPTLPNISLPLPYPLRIQTHAHNQASRSRATLSCDSSYLHKTAERQQRRAIILSNIENVRFFLVARKSTDPQPLLNLSYTSVASFKNLRIAKVSSQYLILVFYQNKLLIQRQSSPHWRIQKDEVTADPTLRLNCKIMHAIYMLHTSLQS